MSAEEGNSSGGAVEKYDMTGDKYAYIFSYEANPNKPTPANVEDTDVIISTLKDLKFQVVNDDDPPDVEMDVEKTEDSDGVHSDDEELDDSHYKNHPHKYNPFVVLNQKPKDLVDYVKNVIGKRNNASCIVLYFIAKQETYLLKTADNKVLPLFNLWKQLDGIKCPVLFFIQANVGAGAGVYSVLLNSEEDAKDGTSYTLPKSAHRLIAYLPNCGNGGKSPAKILSEELRQQFDINTTLTQVIRRLNSEGCRPSPKFSSTLLKQLFMADGLKSSILQEPEKYSCSKNLLAHVFLFGKFNDPELLDLSVAAEHDQKSLEALKDCGFQMEFHITEGKMNVAEFKNKLRKILDDKAVDSCDCFMVIVSSHGEEGGKLHASDGWFSLNSLWVELSNCKKLENKPKVVIVDACRGEHDEDIKTYTTPSSKAVGKGGSSKLPKQPEKKTVKEPHMCDVLIALAALEGKKSYCCNATGSSFIKNLCAVLKTQQDENFLTILNLAMHKLALQTITDQEDKTCKIISVKQQITFTSTLQKDLHFTVKKK